MTAARPTVPSDERACQVPLVEQLRSVPKDAREFVQAGEHEHRNIPYGRMCHDAADAIAALRAERDVMMEALRKCAIFALGASWQCDVCGCEWPYGTPEQHDTGCLAAPQKEPK